MNTLFKYGGILYLIQLFFAMFGLYFWNLLNHSKAVKYCFFKEAEKKSKNSKLRSKITEPLASLSRPDPWMILWPGEGVVLLDLLYVSPSSACYHYGPAG